MSYVAVLRSSLKESFSRKAWCSNLLLGRRGALHCRCSILSSIQSNILSPDNFNDNSSEITSSIIEIEDKDTRKGTIFIASFVQENLMQKELMKIDPFLFNKKLDKINFWKKGPRVFPEPSRCQFMVLDFFPSNHQVLTSFIYLQFEELQWYTSYLSGAPQAAPV